MIMNCSWMVLEQFMCSSWTLIHEQFMNYPWTWNGQVHEVGEVHELGVHRFEFMNLWVHELWFMNSSWTTSSWFVHEQFLKMVHEQFWNSSWTFIHEQFMSSSWIDQLDHVMIMWPMIVMWSRPSPLPNLENLILKSNIYYTIFSVKRLLFNLKYKTKDNLMPSYIF